MRHRLIVGDLLAERLALLRILDRLLERPAAEADRARRIVDTAEGHAIHGDPEPFVELADELPGLDLYVFQHQRAFVTADVAEQLDHALDRKSLGVGRHEEAAD